MDWITDNYQWVFSGIGVFVLGLIFAIFRTRKKRHVQTATSKTSSKVTNEVKAELVNFNQTIITDSKTGDINSKIDNKEDDKPKDHELEKIKEDYLGAKNKTRTFLIKKLAEARHDNTVLQVRHITDLGEDELGLKHEDTVHELEKIEEEGLIIFVLADNESISPYTRIKLTEKYFENI